MDNISKSKIREIQGLLNKLGYYNYSIDGFIENYTIDAIKNFQKNNNLKITGELDQLTIDKIDDYLTGYVLHTIENGDTLYDIARKYNTLVWRIITANPNVNPFDLTIETSIIVPLNFQIVPTNIPYTYNVLENNIMGLSKRYPFLRFDSIGNSVDGRQLYRIRIGNGSNHVIYNGAHHANEWITTPLLMKWIEVFSEVYSRKGSIRGYDTEQIWNYATIDIVPMVNPDGVELVIDGVDNITANKDQLIKWNFGNEIFNDWKSNINGVDLNRNYDAGWKEYKELEKEFGVDGPGPFLYGGTKPESEPESLAMANLTRSIDTRLVLAYHTQGQVIFWNYKDLQPEISLYIGETFAKASGYELASEDLSQSFAGYKDWYILDFRKPGYTIEVGKGKNPLPIDQFDMIYENNEELLLLASII
ncbi:M14 family metallopeptidase [Vallitalea guaymasensis]|uniref:M14 family metallopeptidase n=1 Tax=Vallitalea guaymasensis TaxID=1185412 RepID=UPI000DE3CE7F|nr:M14 family metallopeptidase [Vallitalea guaymasensis]